MFMSLQKIQIYVHKYIDVCTRKYVLINFCNYLYLKTALQYRLRGLELKVTCMQTVHINQCMKGNRSLRIVA